MITTEEKIFSAQSDGALDVFRQIVIPVQATIVQASYNIIPFGIGICNGLACQEPGLYLIPSVSIHTFIASMIGRASS